MTSNKPHDLGDVHAPVEDTKVPISLKLLLVIMILVLTALAVVLVMAITRFGPPILTG